MPIVPQEFDRNRLDIQPLSRRIHDLDLSVIKPLKEVDRIPPALRKTAERMLSAKNSGAAVILMMGAHVLRAGVQRYIIDLMEKGLISCIAANGAGIIHDFEFALIGATTESVPRYIRDGRFGMWRETGRINDIVANGAQRNLGLGEAVGKVIEEEKFPHRGISLFAAGYRLGIPLTVHVGIGYDIIHQLPNCDGAAYGQTSYTDFLRFASVVENLEGGVLMNFGSSVMAPEVYLKALSMARNAARTEDREIKRFTILVCDLAELPEDFHREAPNTEPGYYFRPWKTMLVRTVAEGGESLYVRGDHAETIPALWTSIEQIINCR